MAAFSTSSPTPYFAEGHICQISATEFAHYEITDESLGEGTFGIVRVAIDRKTGNRVAVKITDKSNQRLQEFEHGPIVALQRECQILSLLDHPHIVKLYGGYDDGRKIHWFLSLMQGGTLITALQKEPNAFTPFLIQTIFRQLVDAISYCHSKNIIHRDIKLDNILIRDPGLENIFVVLSDFGFAIEQEVNGVNLTDFPGSPEYSAPELIRGNPYQGRPVDVWSLGVCLYTMVYNALPWYHPDQNKLFYRIVRTELDPPFDVDPTLLELIQGMLTKNPRFRWTLDRVRASAWFNQNMVPEVLPYDPGSETICNLTNVFDQYEISDREFGKGAYGTIQLGRNKTTGEFVAIKIQRKRPFSFRFADRSERGF